MKEVEFFRWYIPEFSSGKLYLSRYKMTVADAQARFPGCKPELGSREVRLLPGPRDSPIERADPPLYQRPGKPL